MSFLFPLHNITVRFRAGPRTHAESASRAVEEEEEEEEGLFKADAVRR